MTEVSPSVVNADDEVILRCSVKFGAPSNTSAFMTTRQFPRLTMMFNNVELTAASQQYTEGQPSQIPHRLTRVSLAPHLSVCLSVCLSTIYRGTAVTHTSQSLSVCLQYTEGQPSQIPHRLTRVSLAPRLSVCLSVCLQYTVGQPSHIPHRLTRVSLAPRLSVCLSVCLSTIYRGIYRGTAITDTSQTHTS